MERCRNNFKQVERVVMQPQLFFYFDFHFALSLGVSPTETIFTTGDVINGDSR